MLSFCSDYKRSYWGSVEKHDTNPKHRAAVAVEPGPGKAVVRENKSLPSRAEGEASGVAGSSGVTAGMEGSADAQVLGETGEMKSSFGQEVVGPGGLCVPAPEAECAPADRPEVVPYEPYIHAASGNVESANVTVETTSNDPTKCASNALPPPSKDTGKLHVILAFNLDPPSHVFQSPPPPTAGITARSATASIQVCLNSMSTNHGNSTLRAKPQIQHRNSRSPESTNV